MGLDTTHDAWHGPYSSFHRFRVELAERAGFPPFQLMFGLFEGFESIMRRESLPQFKGIQWDFVDRLINNWRGLVHLLNHSDCDGEIELEKLPELALALEEILNTRCADASNNFKGDVMNFWAGCKAAIEDKQPIKFH